ncbi:WXG100 family type VII secretion target [Bifidobacterium polysaccharolyticum]|uniref:WXG100 family type VII secretion target n=1 Tax=Bifidobacterium polysaccharolyticum TaxID=2750967 RepID=UPI0018DC3A52|nr:WXG100 family type VII secretion target [Bifidobacterium polysaccharolyticum]MBI0064756.1 WXG100 family type VII secretion target [Bifidobacterium polysaccharolyticum]
MTRFQVDSDQIQTASGAVSGSIGAIRDAVAGMYTNLGNLQSVWQGSAANQFATVAQQWRASQAQMEQALEGIQAALTQASALYADTEAQATRLFAGA